MANLISLSRILITFISLYFLFIGTTQALVIAVVLLILQFALDGVDGYVARKFNETSKLGAVLDIMGDRIAENAYWISFAVLGWLPVAYPLIALTRTIVVDSFRSVAMEQGCTAFGECSMQKDPVGQFICCSKFMRITYAVAKACAFVFLAIGAIPALDKSIACLICFVGTLCAFISIILCVLRGLPVIFESKQFFVKEESN
jgi:CDP-diacylglycerol--glycerol-3-phosphate 3-phosphatidyltransferase